MKFCFNQKKIVEKSELVKDANIVLAHEKKPKEKVVTVAKLVKVAMLSALAFVLYMYAKFPLPFFPPFLDIQVSELPALLAGFSLGPVSGCLVIIFKCLIKMPFSTTMYSGEATDILLGICFVLPASLIYRHKKSKKNAILGLLVGSLLTTVMAVIVNRFISIPLYMELFFKGNWNILLGIVKPLYPNITIGNFYTYYLGLAIVPFNLLRCIVVGVLTFIVYKSLSKILHWEPKMHKHIDKSNSIDGDFLTLSLTDTDILAKKIADSLKGGETILLNGDLGAGKTTFTKSLAKGLGIDEVVTSPTFTILNNYESGRLPLNHLDMYRIESPDELYETGVEDVLLDTGVTVIEWNKFDDLKGKIIHIDILTVDTTKRKFLVVTENRV